MLSTRKHFGLFCFDILQKKPNLKHNYQQYCGRRLEKPKLSQQCICKPLPYMYSILIVKLSSLRRVYNKSRYLHCFVILWIERKCENVLYFDEWSEKINIFTTWCKLCCEYSLFITSYRQINKNKYTNQKTN